VDERWLYVGVLGVLRDCFVIGSEGRERKGLTNAFRFSFAELLFLAELNLSTSETSGEHEAKRMNVPIRTKIDGLISQNRVRVRA
jgi:hypothetical protein